MIDHTTNSIWTTSCTSFTRIDTLISGAHKVLCALVVVATSRLASVCIANFMILTVLILTTQQYTMTAETFFANSTMFINGAFQFAAAIYADVTFQTIDRRQTHSHHSGTTQFGISCEPLWTGTHGVVCDHSAQSIRSTSSGCVAHVFAIVQNASFFVGTFIIVSTSDLTNLVLAYFTTQTFLVSRAS